ncbi:MAG TPA: hypothetical protein VGP94_16755 [Tepidisphaeraceae bacterium]|jgi:hypothetical protein|nr:hypothetical protein [Tepidisphaeraceae bacterium]
MEPQLVIPLDATDHASSGWPRILRIVAFLGVIFAIITIVNAGFSIVSIFGQLGSPLRTSYNSEAYKYQASRGLLAIARAGIGAVMLVAAFRLWRQGLWHRVLMAATRLWLAIWLLNLLLPLYFSPRSVLEFLSGSALQAIIAAAFPLMILLTLREYSKSHPQP